MEVIDRSPPHLNEYNEDDKEKYLSDIEDKHDEICQKFNLLKSNIFLSLEKNPKVSEKRLIIFFESVLEDDPKLSLSLREATSVHGVLVAVKKYFSFCNFEVIEDLVKKFGNKEDKCRLKRYKQRFNKFVFTLCNNRVTLGRHIDGRDRITLKLLNREDENKTLGAFSNRIKKRISKLFGIHRSQLYLCTIRKGCFECDFSVSNSISKRILELKSEARRDLFRDSVTFIEVFCSSSEVWLHMNYFFVLIKCTAYTL